MRRFFLKQMLPLLLCLVTTAMAQADDVILNVPSDDYDEVGKPAIVPEIFLINKRGEFLLKFNKVTRDLASHINAEHQVLGKLESHRLYNATKDKYDFAGSDYTLVFISDADAKTDCPPCVIQAKINRAVLKKIKDKNIRLLTVNKVYSGERTITFHPEEAFEQFEGTQKQ
ncbi:hypothetical protein [Rheinheimera mangrovi]|uniref:hypothetical protein n=1 Tax=Rheinheimera mangrovi TaxID=2498451 RepID=UPI000F8D2FFD|nr:hypothetical protein [Rheinheimera mangrovi]